MNTLERDYEGVTQVAAKYGWSFWEAVDRLTLFFDGQRPRIEAGIITQAEVLALWREHHLRANER